MQVERLFWKFFLAIWGALLTTGLGVGITMSLLHDRSEWHLELEGGSRSAMLIDAAAVVLIYGGVDALRQMITEGNYSAGERLYAVDSWNVDILGRSVPSSALRRVQSLLKANILSSERPSPRMDMKFAGPHEEIRKVITPDQHEFTLFILADPSVRPPPFVGGNSQPHGDPPSPLLPIIAGLLASLAFSALMAWHFSKPVRNLRWAFRAVADGHLETRVRSLMGKRRDEIADLGQHFDLMVQKFQQLLDSQRSLLHDVSHELRSPLARLQAAIDLARQDPGKLLVSLDRVERESMRLDQLVDELLTLSRLEAGTVSEQKNSIDVMELVAGIAEDGRFEAHNSGRYLVFTTTGKASIEGYIELLYRAFENVIRNAVKYTREGTTVEVAVTRGVMSNHVIVRICDYGPGVPDADLVSIFTPFFRGDNASSAAGFGLGLAIARRAIEAHGGSIQASNRSNGGLCIEIVLPVQQ